MKGARIEELVSYLPQRNLYQRQAGGYTLEMRAAPAEVITYAQAMMDPMFGWVLVQSHLESSKWISENITEPSLLRAWCYSKFGRQDRGVRLALQLRTAAEKNRRILLHCLLLLNHCKRSEIAAELQVPEDVICIYEDLFWNVRDRLVDTTYINAIVFPDTTQVTWMPNYHINEDAEKLALRATLNGGISTVRAFLGMTSACVESDAAGQLKLLEAQLASAAVHMARMGMTHQAHIPALQSGRAVLQSGKLGGEQSVLDDDRKGLGSLGDQAMAQFRKMTDINATHILQLQRRKIIEEATHNE